jgi:predicted TIM-barrel fold metal-dependent hydrolase
MKKIFLSVCAVLLTGMVFANKVARESKKEARKEKREMRMQERAIKYGVVSYQTEEQFSMDFPKATDVIFERSQNFDEAEFTLDGQRLRAYYDISNELIGTTNIASYSELPASAQKEIEKFYKDYELKQILFFHDNQFNDSDIIIYGTSFDDADNWFVQLQKDSKKIIVKVSPSGIVSYYTQMK